MKTAEQIENRIDEYKKVITDLEENPLPQSVHFVTVAGYAYRIQELQWMLNDTIQSDQNPLKE